MSALVILLWVAFAAAMSLAVKHWRRRRYERNRASYEADCRARQRKAEELYARQEQEQNARAALRGHGSCYLRLKSLAHEVRDNPTRVVVHGNLAQQQLCSAAGTDDVGFAKGYMRECLRQANEHGRKINAISIIEGHRIIDLADATHVLMVSYYTETGRFVRAACPTDEQIKLLLREGFGDVVVLHDGRPVIEFRDTFGCYGTLEEWKKAYEAVQQWE